MSDNKDEAQGSAGDFGRGDRDGDAGGHRPEDNGGNYDPSQGASPRAFASLGDPAPSYGGSGREVHGGGEAGRGADDPFVPGSAGKAGGTSGASSAIDDGQERRAASGQSGSVSGEVREAQGNATAANRTDTARPTTAPPPD